MKKTNKQTNKTNELQSWEKALGHLFICGNYLKSPTLNPTNNAERVHVHPDFFASFILYRVGRGEKRELQDIFKKVSLFYEGTQNYRKLPILPHFPQEFC